MMSTNIENELESVSSIQKMLLKEIVQDEKPQGTDEVIAFHRDVDFDRWSRLAKKLNSLPGITKSPLEWKMLWKHYNRLCEKEKSAVNIVAHVSPVAVVMEQSIITSCKKKYSDIQQDKTESQQRGQQSNAISQESPGTITQAHTWPSSGRPVKLAPYKRSLDNESLCLQIIQMLAKQPSEELKEKELNKLTLKSFYDCKWMCQQMLNETQNKIRWLMQAEDCPDRMPPPKRMSFNNWMIFDTVLVHREIDLTGVTIDTVNVCPNLVELFELVKEHRVETLTGERLAQAWATATLAYNQHARTVTPMLLQKRWFELKRTTRTRYYAHAAHEEAAPAPLQVAIAKQYPEVWTRPFCSWEQLVNSGRVILRERFERLALQQKIKNRVILALTENPATLNNAVLNPAKLNPAELNIPIAIVKDEDSDIEIEENNLDEELRRSQLRNNGDSAYTCQNAELSSNSRTTFDEMNETMMQTEYKLEECEDTANADVSFDESMLQENELKVNEVNIEIEGDVSTSNETQTVLPKITNVFGNVKVSPESLRAIALLAKSISLNSNSSGPDVPEQNLLHEVANELLLPSTAKVCKAAPRRGKRASNIGAITKHEARVKHREDADVSRINCKLQSNAIEQAIPPEVQTVTDFVNRPSKVKKSASRSKRKAAKAAATFKLKSNGKLYDLQQINRNPDFNIRLKNLSAKFFLSLHNSSLLATCKPVTVDVVKLRSFKNFCIQFNNKKKQHLMSINDLKPNVHDTDYKAREYCRDVPKPAIDIFMANPLEKYQNVGGDISGKTNTDHAQDTKYCCLAAESSSKEHALPRLGACSCCRSESWASGTDAAANTRLLNSPQQPAVESGGSRLNVSSKPNVRQVYERLKKNEILLTTTKLPSTFKTFYSEMLQNIRLNTNLAQYCPELSSTLSDLVKSLVTTLTPERDISKFKNINLSLDIILKSEVMTPVTSRAALEYACSRDGFFVTVNLNTGCITPLHGRSTASTAQCT